MPWITPVQKTLLKLRPIVGHQLGANEFRERLGGDKLGIVSIRKAENNHWQIRMAGDLTIGGTKTRECYIWPGHWDHAAAALVQSIDAARDKAVSLSVRPTLPISDGKLLDISYKSQTDNQNNPTGSCNVTSCAIALEYWGIKGGGLDQFEDELYEWLEENGLSRHDPNHLARLINAYSCRDDFTTRAGIDQIKAAIDNGIPVIIHGYFTSFGHIIVAIGYNSKGLICHDPYGEWTSAGYIRNDASNPKRGEAIVYGYGLIDRTCLPDGGCWAHFVTRSGANSNPSVSTNSTPAAAPAVKNRNSGFWKPQEFRVTEAARSIINSWEGWSASQYFCSANKSTIGWGSTRWFDGGDIPIGATVNEAQAKQLQDRDLKEFVGQIAAAIDVPLTENQLSALISWQYNTGAIGAKQCGLRDAINRSAGDAAIVHEFRRCNKADGAVSQGLVNRRESEIALWEGRDWRQYRG